MGGKDLAGLAALGALGMMMSKGKKSEDTSGMDTSGFEGIKELPRRDTGMSEKEPGGPDFGSEKEPAENYSTTRAKPVVSAPKMRSSPKGPNPLLQSNADPESTRRMITNMGGYSGVDEAGRPYRPGMKKGGVVKMAKGGMTSSASSRGDGIAQRGKTKGTMVACGGGYMKGKK